jgi:SAM-dependent methyltransferase
VSTPVYDTIGRGYTAHRRPDPRWAAVIEHHVAAATQGDSVVVNVGAGTGSYERTHCRVLAVEPSAVMIAQRRVDAAPAVRASASALPLPNDCADLAMALMTVHHWADPASGLSELRRVARRQIVFAIEFDLHARFWLLEEYLPEVADYVRACRPDAREIAASLGATESVPMLVPRDLQDGVMGAFWCRPEAYLDPCVRANASGLALADPAVIARGVQRLEADLNSGAWQRRHDDLSTQDSIDLGYRLLISG